MSATINFFGIHAPETEIEVTNTDMITLRCWNPIESVTLALTDDQIIRLELAIEKVKEHRRALAAQLIAAADHAEGK